jgi:hypothetical protein
MTDVDTFGRDPQVRYMRRIFASLEEAQNTFLGSAHISPAEGRLRQVREHALKMFERSWFACLERTNAAADDIAVDIYLICLGKALIQSGFDVPDDVLPRRDDLRKLVDEVLT